MYPPNIPINETKGLIMKNLFITTIILTSTSGFAKELNGLSLKELNDIVKTLDQVKIMDEFKGELKHSLKDLTLTKKLFVRRESGFKCVSKQMDLADAFCEALPHNLYGDLPPVFMETYGEYTVGLDGYNAICEAVPGEWTKTGYNLFEKPVYMGLECKKHGYSGH